MYSAITRSSDNALLENYAGFFLHFPETWRKEHLEAQHYVSFMKSINNGLHNRPIMGTVMFGYLSEETTPQIIEIVKYLNALKQEGSAFVDCGGDAPHARMQTLKTYHQIKRCGFRIDNIDDIDNPESALRYNMDRITLQANNIEDLTTYSSIDLFDTSKIEKLFKFLSEYGVTSHILSPVNMIDNFTFDKMLQSRDSLFKTLVNIREMSKQYGIDYLIYEDHCSLFRNRYDETDIIFYTLHGGIRVDLMPDGHVMLYGGRQPYDAGIWTPDQDAFEFIISVFKQNNDLIWRRLTAEKKPWASTSNTKFRSSVLASAIMAGKIGSQTKYINEI